MAEPFRVLAVDDVPANLLVLQALLETLPGLELVQAQGGEQALRMVLEQEVHLILLDVQMPGMDGYETAGHLRSIERTREIPVIFLTGVYRGEEFSRRGYAQGAVDYLIKPLDDNLLLNRVRHYQHLHERGRALAERSVHLQAATEQLQATLDQLHCAQDQMLQAEKLAALGRIVAAVAHELNTPLGNCITVTSTLEARVREFDAAMLAGPLHRRDLTRFFETVQESVALLGTGLNRAVDLVQHFKQVSVDQSSSRRREFELKSVIDSAVALMQLKLRHSPVRISCRLEDGLQMDSYPGHIEQLVSNLIDNAMLHGFEGREQGQLTIAAMRAGVGKVRLEVSDDGCGMSEEVRHRAFEPFYTTKFGRGGSGLGLSICYSMVTGPLGGHLELQSEPGQGSRFIIDLPCVAPAETLH